MAGNLDVGTLSGKIELEDNTSATLLNVSSKVDLLAQRFDALGGRVQQSKEQQDALGSTLESIGGRFERVGERIAEYFAIREVVHFVSDITESALALQNLSLQTDISVTDLQVLGTATREYGVDSEQLGRAIFQLSQRIAGGDQSAATALAMMGISLKQVEGLNGKDLFLKIESGLATLQGTAKEAAAADLFGGRLGKSMIAFAGNADEALDRAKALGVYVGEDSIKQLADYQRNIDLATSNLKNLAAQGIGPVAEGFNVLFNTAGKMGQWKSVLIAAWQDMASSSVATGASTSHLADLLDALNRQEEATAAGAKKSSEAHMAAVEPLTAEAAAARFLSTVQVNAAQELTPWQEKDLEYLKSIGELNAKNAAAIGVNAVQLKAYEESVKANAEANKKYAEALTEMDSVGHTWHDTLQSLDGETVESVKYYLEAGISQEKLAAAYGLTIVQVKAIAESEKAEIEGRKEVIAQTEALAKAEDALTTARINASQKALATQEANDEAYYKQRYDRGLSSETQYQNAIISVKQNYAQKSEGLFQQQMDIETKAVSDAEAKQVSTLQDRYNQGKIDDDSYEQALTDITQAAEDKRDAIRITYDQARKDRQAKTQQDIQALQDSFSTMGGTGAHAFQLISEAAATLNNDIENTDKKVLTLAGDLVTAAEAKAKLDQGGSTAVTSANFAQQLQQFLTTGGWNPAATGVQTYRDPYALAHAGYSFQEIILYAYNKDYQGQLPPAQGPKIPGFAEGGVGDFGAGTLAMLHGKEAIIPLNQTTNTDLGTNYTNYFAVNGTAEESARKIANILMGQLKLRRLYGAA